MEGISETYYSENTSYNSDSRNFMLFLSYSFSNVPFVALGSCHHILVFSILLDCFCLQKTQKEEVTHQHTHTHSDNKRRRSDFTRRKDTCTRTATQLASGNKEYHLRLELHEVFGGRPQLSRARELPSQHHHAIKSLIIDVAAPVKSALFPRDQGII